LKEIGDITCSPEKGEVLRMMGFRRRVPIPARVEAAYRDVEARLGALIHARAVVGFFAPGELPESGVFRGAQRISLSVCTIGSALEEEVTRLFSSGENLEALVLDAMGSACVESAADFVNRYIENCAREEGLAVSRRFSPGYGAWPLEEQRWLFELMGMEPAGVVLNESCLMIPRKSISFAVKMGKLPEASPRGGPCSICGLKNCNHRRGELAGLDF